VSYTRKFGTSLPVYIFYGTVENKIVTVGCKTQTLQKIMNSKEITNFKSLILENENPVKSYIHVQ